MRGRFYSHASNNMHSHVMSLLQKERADASGLSISSYAPTAMAFDKLSEGEREKLKVKFDIAYFVVMQKLAFAKYPKICGLEAHHGVNVGSLYRNDVSGWEFLHY